MFLFFYLKNILPRTELSMSAASYESHVIANDSTSQWQSPTRILPRPLVSLFATGLKLGTGTSYTNLLFWPDPRRECNNSLAIHVNGAPIECHSVQTIRGTEKFNRMKHYSSQIYSIEQYCRNNISSENFGTENKFKKRWNGILCVYLWVKPNSFAKRDKDNLCAGMWRHGGYDLSNRGTVRWRSKVNNTDQWRNRLQ